MESYRVTLHSRRMLRLSASCAGNDAAVELQPNGATQYQAASQEQLETSPKQSFDALLLAHVAASLRVLNLVAMIGPYHLA